MSGTLTFLPLSRETVPVVTRLYARTFEEPWPEAAIGDLLKGTGSWGLLACRDERPVGFALCRTVVDEAEILTFGIDPDLRRTGIGRQMLKEVIKISARNADYLYLEVGADNPAAHALYLSSGFQEVGRRKKYYRRADRSLVDALIMRRALLDDKL